MPSTPETIQGYVKTSDVRSHREMAMYKPYTFTVSQPQQQMTHPSCFPCDIQKKKKKKPERKKKRKHGELGRKLRKLETGTMTERDYLNLIISWENLLFDYPG